MMVVQCDSHAPLPNIASDELATLIHAHNTNKTTLVLLDCRPGCETTTTFACAQRIQLPTVLMRRLRAGTLSPANLSSSLAEPSRVSEVVVVPAFDDNESCVAAKIVSTLIKHGFRCALFTDDPKAFLDEHPEARQVRDGQENEIPTSNGLNLRSGGDMLNNTLANVTHECETRPPVEFPALILRDVYLGNIDTAKNAQVLKKLNIHYIINVTTNLPNYFEHEPGFFYLRIPVDDNAAHNLSKHFPDAIEFINKARSEHAPVLVHCLAGISRSVTVCLAYLMYDRRSSLNEAFDQLLQQNAAIQPNFHFMTSLKLWERSLYDSDSAGNSLPSSTVSTTSAASACSSA